jgi:hypothetical protein
MASMLTLSARALLIFASLLSFQITSATSMAQPASPTSSCALPSELNEEVAHKNPNAHIVELSDLNENDRELFQKDHKDRCPGLVRVDFYGDGNPTWAFILLGRVGTKQIAKLFIGRQSANKWEISAVDSADGPAPVV